MNSPQNIIADRHTVFAERFTDVDFGVRPQTATCAAILDRRQHAFLGISPFNSRFSDEYLLRLARWAARQFEKFDFLLPDEESTSLLRRATGTAQGRALRKSRQQLARNARAISAALDHLDVKSTASPSGIARFTDAADNWNYRCARALCQLTYETEQQFHQACLDMVFMMIGAANRDPAAFENPDRFDLRRSDLSADRSFTAAAQHMAFGTGIHASVGADFARDEIATAAGIVLDLLPDLALADPDNYQEMGLYTRGPKSLSLDFTPAR